MSCRFCNLEGKCQAQEYDDGFEHEEMDEYGNCLVCDDEDPSCDYYEE